MVADANLLDRLASGPARPVSLLPKGTAFTRVAIAIAVGRNKLLDSENFARERWPHDPEVARVVRAAVEAGGTTTWAGQLAVTPMMADFIEALRPATIVGRMSGVRSVPFNVTMARTTAGSSAYWVAPGAPKPASRLTVDNIALEFSKIASIVALTDEVLRLSTPSAEAVVRRDLIGALAELRDVSFIDPTIAAVANTSPASISYGAPFVTSTGATVANICTDVAAMFALGIAGNISYATGVFVMHPRTAVYLSQLRSAADVFAFPTVRPNGGTFFGLPVITSSAVPIDTGADTYIFLIDAQEVLLAEGAVTIDASREASLQIDDAPQAGAQSQTSLWQSNLTALKAEQYLNWKLAHAAGCVVLTDVSY